MWKRNAPAPRPAPWEFVGLPDGLNSQDFNDAATALRTGGHVGRVQALPNTSAHSSRLYATERPANKARIRSAKSMPALADAAVFSVMSPGDRAGQPIPAILWADPSPSMTDVRPVAVILPTGYAGSVWNAGGTVLADWVDSHRRSGWLWATVAVIAPKGADVSIAVPIHRMLGLR